MTSEVDIVNIGLDMCGAEAITSLTEGSNNSNVANRIYPVYRDFLLRRYIWKFATKRIKLAQSSNLPVYEFDYQYPVPSDFIRLIDLHDNQDGLGLVPYKIEYDATDTRVLSCSSSEIWITYVAKVTDPNVFGPDFIMALASKMAMTFALKIAESRALYNDLKLEYKEVMRGARSVAGQEDWTDQMPNGTWVNTRGFDSSGDWSNG